MRNSLKRKKNLLFSHLITILKRISSIRSIFLGNKSVSKIFRQLRVFFFSWRFILVFIFFLAIIINVAPINIWFNALRALSGKTEIINLYASQTINNKDVNTQEGWFNIGNAQGAPEIGPLESSLAFNDENSSFLNKGNGSLIAENFVFLHENIKKTNISNNNIDNGNIDNSEIEPEIEDKKIELPSSPISTSSLDLPVDNTKTATSPDEKLWVETDELLNKSVDSEKAGSSAQDKKQVNISSDNEFTQDPIVVPNIEDDTEVEILEPDVNDNAKEILIQDNIQETNQEDIQETSQEDIQETKELSKLNKIKNFFINKIKNFFNNKIAFAQEYINNNVGSLKELGKFNKAEINFSLAIIKRTENQQNKDSDETQNNFISSSSPEYPVINQDSTNSDKQQSLEENTQPADIVPLEKASSTASSTARLENTLRNFFGIRDAFAQEEVKKSPKLIIWYSLADTKDGTGTEELWYKLDTITNNNFSNNINNGYLSYEADFLNSWQDVENLHIRIEVIDNNEDSVLVYLDSLWVAAEYEREDELPKTEKRNRWENALEFLSKQTVFNINESSELRFRYNKKENRIWDTLKKIIGVDNFWKQVDISVDLLNSKNKKVDMDLTVVFEEDGEFKVSIANGQRQLKPGKYSLNFNITDRSGEEPETFRVSQEFYWGVIAFNTDKDVYKQGEEAYLQFGVLDNSGHTICDADIELKIKNPDGSINNLSTNNQDVFKSQYCSAKSITSQPDYYTNYELSQTGEYKIDIIARTAGGIKKISKKILVVKSNAVSIKRQAPTRINPKADYNMTIKIKAESSFKGVISDLVPVGFKISNYSLRIIDNSYIDPFGPAFSFTEKNNGDTKQLIWQDVEIDAGDTLEISYTFDAPNVSPELFLLGPLKFGEHEEQRQWQLASDAVNKRARTVQFLAGTYSGGATSGQGTNSNQFFSSFNFRLAETGVDIKNAFIIFESQFEAYNVNGGNYTGYNIAFDACEENCTANAFSGSGRVLRDDNTILAYNEAESNQGRILVDVTKEAQLANYTGGGVEMEAQIGYKLESANTVNSIASAKAILVLTYDYDRDSENLTNTVIYPLSSTDTTHNPDDSGTKQEELVGDCTKNTDCPLFDYKMEIPEWSGLATGTNRVSQWFTTYMVNDRHGGSDIDTTVNIEGTDIDSNSFHHESADGSTQANVSAMLFGPVSGFAENSAQQLEFVPVSPAGNNDYDSIGGEAIETYIASSSATTKTRTVSFPIGVVNNGQTTLQTYASANVFLPENGTATGTVKIKKAWLRIISNNYNSGAYDTTVTTKVGANATSSAYNYRYDAGALVPKPSFNIIHIIPAADYAALEEANANSDVEIILSTQNDSTVTGGLSAELMITYTYSSEDDGYLSSLQIFSGQTTTNPATNTTATTAPAVFPEPGAKTIRGASLLVSYLNSDSLGDVSVGTVFKMDANLSASSPSCSPSYIVEPDDINTFSEFYKDVSNNMNTTDEQVYNICLVDDDTTTTSDGAKANAILSYTYQWDNSPPTGSFIKASTTQKIDGTGIVDIGISVDDSDDQDLRAKIEYATGTACLFTASDRPTIDESDVNITANYGDPDVDNNNTYQIGTPSAYIQTSSGANSVYFDWQAGDDLINAEGYYCLRLNANDTMLDQTNAATTTVYIDTKEPTMPGALSFVSRTGASTTLKYGSASTETNFKEYKIFYKVYDGSNPTESDSVWSSTTDANLGNILFNSASTTVIGGLNPKTTYSYAIWAYDIYGNRASSSRVDIMTNDAPVGSFNTGNTGQKNDGTGIVDIDISVDDANNDDQCRAKLEYTQGATCDFSVPLNPSLDESSISADYGVPVIDNNTEYQIGSSTGWIVTSFGVNDISFDWLGKTDEAAADGTYCLRLIVNDGMDDQYIAATTTISLDNVKPISTGSLTESQSGTDYIKLSFATTSPGQDTNEPAVDAYKIFYKQGTSGVNENDIEVDSGALDAYDYSGVGSTTVSGLDSNTWYVFNIWTYDSFGNKASATEISIKTDATIFNNSLTFINPESEGADNNIAVAGPLGKWTFRAVVTETNGWYSLASSTLRLANRNDETAPYSDLAFSWDQSSQLFSEIGDDTLNMASLSSEATSSCSGISCTLDFVIIFNKNFASSSYEYTAELTSANDFNVIDQDQYAGFYQVRYPYIEQAHYRWRKDDGGE